MILTWLRAGVGPSGIGAKRRPILPSVLSYGVFAFLFGAVCLWKPASLAQPADRRALNLGFAATHIGIAADAEALCASGGASADLSGDQAIIAHYDNAGIRERAVAALRNLHQAGATAVKGAFWFRSAEDLVLDKLQTARPDPLGLMVAEHGKLPSKYPENLVHFAEDVREIGYRHLVIGLGNEGRSNPVCRADGEWSKCYDPRFDLLHWSAAEQMIRAVKARPLPGLEVYFEIAGEACFIHDPNSLLQRSLEHSVRFAVERYEAAFSDSGYIVSCIAGERKRTLTELVDTSAYFAQLRYRPAFIDLHLYSTDETEIEQALIAGDAAAQRLAVPLMIGETFADNEVLFKSIKQMRERGQLTTLQDVLVWPRRIGATCETDVNLQDVLDWALRSDVQR